MPSGARRGTADIDVTIRRDNEQSTISASFQVVSRGDDIDASFHELPAAVRRGDGVTLRADVTDGSTCSGSVTLDDTRVLGLASQTERRNRCRWTHGPH